MDEKDNKKFEYIKRLSESLERFDNKDLLWHVIYNDIRVDDLVLVLLYNYYIKGEK